MFGALWLWGALLAARPSPTHARLEGSQAIVVLGRLGPDGLNAAAVQDAVRGVGAWAPALFVVLQVLVTRWGSRHAVAWNTGRRAPDEAWLFSVKTRKAS